MKYIDYALISWLNSSRGRHDFSALVERDIGVHIEDSPLMRVFYIQELHNQRNKTEPSVWEDLILDMESALIPVLAHMEHTWVLLDKDKITDIGTRVRRDIVRTELEIYEVVGERFNIASPKQIQEIFVKLGIPLTKKNKTWYSVDVDVLEEIAKKYDIARLILEYRSLAKLESTYITALLKSIDNITGRIHTTYDTLGASTGRMSSNDPNLQNIPTGDGYAREIKSSFIPTSGNILLVADYSQVELRVLAFLSWDTALIEAFQKWEDIHMRTARFLFPNLENITSHERRIAKSVNFWVIYGITGFWLSKTLECSPWEANAYIEAFYTKYPGVRTYYDTLLEKWRERWYVETYFGRRRYIPGLSDANKTIRSISEREAMNMPVQWTAADMLKIAMIAIDTKISEHALKGKMILQVHDELVFDIPVWEKDIFEKIVRESMEQVLEKNPWADESLLWVNIPIVVDIHSWPNWADAKG